MSLTGHEIYEQKKMIPVILTSQSIKLRQHKFLLNSKQTIAEFMYFLKQHKYVKTDTNASYWLQMKNYNLIPQQSENFSSLYYHFKHSQDGFLHINIEQQWSFG
jgi:hypothetical protein